MCKFMKNTTTLWNREDEALQPQEQGKQYFLSLHTGRRIIKNNWVELLMPNAVVGDIHQLTEASKQAGGITLMKNMEAEQDDDKEEEINTEDDEPIPVTNNIPSIQEETAVTDI